MIDYSDLNKLASISLTQIRNYNQISPH